MIWILSRAGKSLQTVTFVAALLDAIAKNHPVIPPAFKVAIGFYKEAVADTFCFPVQADINRCPSDHTEPLGF